MSISFEHKSALAEPVSLQLDTEDTLVESPKTGIINTSESLLEEIARLREENRLLKEELGRLKSVQMVSVATQTSADDLKQKYPPSPKQLPSPQIVPQPLALVKPSASSSPVLASAPSTIEGRRSLDNESKTIKEEEGNVPVTFYTPLKYSKECQTFKLDFPRFSNFEDIVEKYWLNVPIDLSKDIFYDQLKDVLLCEECSVSCALVQIEPTALVPLFYIARRWGSDITLAKKLASYDIQNRQYANSIFNENGLFRKVLGACLTVYCKPFIRNTLKKAYKAVADQLSSSVTITLDEMSIQIPCALDRFLTATLDGLSNLPEQIVSITHIFMRAAHAKFPELKQALFGAIAFCEIVCTALENPEKYDIYKGGSSPEIDCIMKVILKAFKSACCRTESDVKRVAVEEAENERVEKESEEADDAEKKKDGAQKRVDGLIMGLRNDIIIAQSRIRSAFKKFVLKNSESTFGRDDDEWFSQREYEKNLRWTQTLLRSYPDKFKKYFGLLIQNKVTEDIDKIESDDKLIFSESDTEIINNSITTDAGSSSNSDNSSTALNELKEPIEENAIFKEATRLSFLQLHPRFDYHLKVHGTDHYVSEDPAFTGHPLREWPLMRLYNEGSLALEFDFVDNKEFDDDQYVATQIARIAGTEYRWSLLSDEAYLFSQVLYRAVPHVNREYPINRARTETTPFPPQLERSFIVVVFLPDGTASKTCKCDLETRTAELLGTITAKFLRDTKKVFKPEEIALKAVGKEQYLLHDDNRPVSSCSYIRDSLRKNQRPSFVIVERERLVLETPFDVTFDAVAPPPPDAVSSLAVQRPLEVIVGSATCLGQGRGRVLVECAAYYAGRKISVLSETPFESASDETGLFTWNSSVSLGMQIPTIPRETLLCFGLYSVDETGKRSSLAWTSCRLFDHTARLISGSHSLPLLAGEPNPIGICVHAMGLQTRAQLKVVFPNYENGHPIIHFTCIKDDAVVPFGRLAESVARVNIFGNGKMAITDESIKKIAKEKGNSRNRSFTARLASFARTKTPATMKSGLGAPESAGGGGGGGGGALAPTSSLVRLISESDEARLYALIEKDSLYVLSLEEQKFVWTHREHLRSKPISIIKIAQSVPWLVPAATRAMHRLLDDWPLIDPVRALELLDGKYPDVRLREYAVRCIEQMGVDELDDYIMQLVQALKCETYHRSPLALFMLKAAISNRLPLGHTLFLMLKAELHIAEVRERFTLFLKCYLRASGMHRDVIIQQLDLTDALMVANKNKSFQNLENFPLKGPFFLPHDPTLCVSRLIIEKCRVLGSARAPLWLAFENADKLSKDPVCVLFKAADDLRQDMLALQVIKLMGKFWEGDGLDMRLTLYKCVALGPAVGMIELVPDCTTIADIQKIMGGGVTSAFKEKTIAEWLRRKSPGKDAFENVTVNNFIHSLAGYCIATYLIGVGDRHNDNVMLKNDGHLFHIDFGHILGNAEKWNGIKRDRAPFVLTPEFVYVMGGKKSEGFTKFCDVACEAYNVIRKYSSTFITLFTMMLSTDIPELRSEEDVYYLKMAFNTELGGSSGDEAAKEFFKGLILQSLGTKMTRINNAIHIAVHPHINDAHDTNLK